MNIEIAFMRLKIIVGMAVYGYITIIMLKLSDNWQ